MTEAYPLHWPEGWPRTRNPERSRFDVSHARAQAELLDQLRLMGARYVVISTNVELRRDGLPYASGPQSRAPSDTGVAVYFQRRGKQMTFACDRWDRIGDNIRAISKTIEAMRGIERWGASDMMERAFAAFEALPPPGAAVQASCWDILGLEPGANAAAIKAAWRARLHRLQRAAFVCEPCLRKASTASSIMASDVGGVGTGYTRAVVGRGERVYGMRAAEVRTRSSRATRETQTQTLGTVGPP